MCISATTGFVLQPNYSSKMNYWVICHSVTNSKAFFGVAFSLLESQHSVDVKQTLVSDLSVKFLGYPGALRYSSKLKRHSSNVVSQEFVLWSSSLMKPCL